MKVQYLHISDIHCGYENYTVGNMRELMANEIYEFIDSKGQKIEYIFITGDLKYGKFNPEKYPEGTLDFIYGLQEKFGVERKNTFVVPGNHDVTRGFIREAAIGKIKQKYSSRKGIIEDKLLDALSQTTCEFKNIYYDICGREYTSNHFFVDLGPLNIIHLNTALICGMDGEDGSLIIGMSLLKEALRNMDISKPSIVLAHHSLDCLSTEEQLELERFLKNKNAILYLCGHKHVAQFSNILISEKNKPLWQFLCGTNMDEDPNLDSTDMDVFVGVLDTDSSSGYIDAYKWSFKNGHWIPDSEFSYKESKTTDGRIYYPSKEYCLYKDVINRYLRFLEYSCSDIRLDGLPVDGYIGSRKFALDELYVPIKFKRKFSSLQEEIDAKFDELFGPQDGTVSKYHKSPFEDEIFNSVVLAGPGCGKTTFIKRVIHTFCSNKPLDNAEGFLKFKLFPIWIRCRSLNTQNDTSLMSIIRDLPSVAEFPPNQDLVDAFIDAVISKLTKGEAVILIDGLDEISNIQKRGVFIEQIEYFSKQYPKNRIIITSRIAGFEDYKKSGLSDFFIFEIEPFTDQDIRELCIKWHIAVINSLDTTINSANQLADTIINHSRIKALATNPLLLTTLLLVQRRIGRLPTKRSALYEESIRVLLETWNQEGHAPMDLSAALCKLAYIAFVMTVKGFQEISRRDLIEILDSAKEDLKRRLSFDDETPERFLKRTEQRSSIIVRAGFMENTNGTQQEVYEFQHLTFQEYLTSVAIVNKYYPKAKRTDDAISILKDKNGIDAFGIPVKEEIVLLTAALLGWDAEDIAISIIERLKELSKDISDKTPYGSDVDSANEEYGVLSALSLKLILDDIELELDTIDEIVEMSFSKPSIYTTDLLEKLIDTKYGTIIRKQLARNIAIWIDNNPSLTQKLLSYVEITPDIINSLLCILMDYYDHNRPKYNEVSAGILAVFNELDLSNDKLIELFKICTHSITIFKGQSVIEIFRGPYSQLIKKVCEEEYDNWIDAHNVISPYTYTLSLIDGLEENDVFAYYTSNITDDESTIIKALMMVDTFYWFRSSDENKEFLLTEKYQKDVWKYLADNRILIKESALSLIATLLNCSNRRELRSLLSLEQSYEVLFALDDIIINNRFKTYLFYLFLYIPPQAKPAIHIKVPLAFKQLVSDRLTNASSYSDRFIVGIVICNILYKCISSYVLYKSINDFDNDLKERLNLWIEEVNE